MDTETPYAAATDEKTSHMAMEGLNGTTGERGVQIWVVSMHMMYAYLAVLLV